MSPPAPPFRLSQRPSAPPLDVPTASSRGARPERLRVGYRLASLFQRLGNQPDLVDARALGNVDDLRHLAKRQAGITRDEHHPIVARLEDVLQTRAEHAEIDRVLVDPDPALGIDRDHDRPVDYFLVLLGIR